MAKGIFITIEGIDGCGKTTQSVLLYRYLKSKNLKVLSTREPGGTVISENIRRMLLFPEFKMDKITELLLYNAARNQHIKEVILPALKKGYTVICERFSDATIAYQGYGRKIPLDVIEKINEIVVGGLKPNLTILLDLPIKDSIKRLRSKDRFESQPLSFYKRVREGYLKIVSSESDRVKIVNAKGNINKVHNEIKKIVDEFIAKWHSKR